MAKRVSPDEISRMVHLRKKGLGIRRISKLVGRDFETVRRNLIRAGSMRAELTESVNFSVSQKHYDRLSRAALKDGISIRAVLRNLIEKHV